MKLILRAPRQLERKLGDGSLQLEFKMVLKTTGGIPIFILL